MPFGWAQGGEPVARLRWPRWAARTVEPGAVDASSIDRGLSDAQTHEDQGEGPAKGPGRSRGIARAESPCGIWFLHQGLAASWAEGVWREGRWNSSLTNLMARASGLTC